MGWDYGQLPGHEPHVDPPKSKRGGAMVYEQKAWALRTKDGKWESIDGHSKRLDMDSLFMRRGDTSIWKKPGDRIVRVKVRIEVEK